MLHIQSETCSVPQVDLVKDEGHLYFIRFLSDPEEGTTAQTRAQAAFVLATICVGVPQPSRPAGSCDPAQQVNPSDVASILAHAGIEEGEVMALLWFAGRDGAWTKFAPAGL